MTPPTHPTSTPHPEAANIQAVADLERQTRRERTWLERVIDRVGASVSSTGFIVCHVGWFSVWIGLNVFSAHPFDPFPFNVLTLAVSLEAIVLTGFVLVSQARMTQLADRRAHLDLQVNLLAEQELTAILKVVGLLAEKAGVDVQESVPNLDRLLKRTDVTALAEELGREMAAVEEQASSPAVPTSRS
jgi:uncharacterized membrane protein